jgi:hypothetical protein
MNIKFARTLGLTLATLALPAKEPATVILQARGTSIAPGSRRWTLIENGLLQGTAQVAETYRLPANRSLAISAVTIVFRGRMASVSRGATFQIATRTQAGTVDLATFTERVPAGLGTAAISRSFPCALPVPAGAEIILAPLEIHPDNGQASVEYILYGTYVN